ncbi:uncharacterized protein LOC110812246 [Carica papaya]|uniref:uncharacterized protein LOC110812246 n=1 Tax=Carica papaya TaxID=3649 RepID=UPI000B8CC599|nr:uncharacterized protein LOC110812246 [Carica papaya]
MKYGVVLMVISVGGRGGIYRKKTNMEEEKKREMGPTEKGMRGAHASRGSVVALPGVIDIDEDKASADTVILDEKADTRNKGKAVERDDNDFGIHEAKQAATRTLVQGSKVECSSSTNPRWHNFLNLDCGSYGDYYIKCNEDFMDVDHASLQVFFDSTNIPAGVEVSIPLLPEFAEHTRNTETGHNPLDEEAPVKLEPVYTYELGVIDIDEDKASADTVILDEKADTRNKGKAVERDDNDFGIHEAKQAATRTLVQGSKVECSSSTNPRWHNFLNLDCGSYGDYYIKCNEDFMDVDHASLQVFFDSTNIPAGVEVSIPLLPEFAEHTRNTETGHNPLDEEAPVKLEPVYTYELGSFASSSSGEPAFPRMEPAPVLDLNFLAQENTSGHPAGLDMNLPLPVLPTLQSQIDFATSQSQQLLQSDEVMLAVGAGASFMGHLTVADLENQLGGSSSGSNQPPELASPLSWLDQPLHTEQLSALEIYTIETSFFDSFNIVGNSLEGERDTPSAENSPRIQTNVDEADLLRKFQQFKQFDIVEDHSDHYYTSRDDSAKQSSKTWAKRVQEEWRILENNLPETILVRVYESRMDLMRAVIVGAEGTPYHDGLFFFDVFFPPDYPYSPPSLHYHSGGYRLNPNLYECGKVCLSLLNTWSGRKNEKWIPGVSTMLQVFVSIQALILNQDPFFNEPGFEIIRGSKQGEMQSQDYNEAIFILSVKTMAFLVRKQPKNFEDFIVGHFYTHAHDILAACKAYTEGAPLGSIVQGGIQDVDAGGMPPSNHFKECVAKQIVVLVAEFTALGVEDCDKFAKPANVGNGHVHPDLNLSL